VTVPTRQRDVVVIGGSAGAVEALSEFLRGLPSDFDAAVAVVLHRHPSFVSSLALVFGRHSALEVTEPEQGDRFEPGRIYLAPRDRHMTVYDQTIQLNRQPRQHHTRPAIDPLFRSAASSYGNRVIGVLLTGNLSDGVGGLIDIKERGGLSLVQDPGQAPFPSMPKNAIIYDHVDLVFEIGRLAELLIKLVRGESLQSAVSSNGARRVQPGDEVPPRWVAAGHKLP
jgi:two-component system chemotaxis response regulator CheB